MFGLKPLMRCKERYNKENHGNGISNQEGIKEAHVQTTRGRFRAQEAGQQRDRVMRKRFILLTALLLARGANAAFSSSARCGLAASDSTATYRPQLQRPRLEAIKGTRGGGAAQGAAKKVGSRSEPEMETLRTGLGRLRDAVFPIYGGEEAGKFFALGGIQFFIIFVLTLTRDLKDTLIITSCGAEAVSFLKVHYDK